MSIKVLVFPCGSEIGLEIYRSLQYSIHVDLIGGSSVDDHGKFVYEKYIGNIPDVSNSEFLDKLNDIITAEKIDAIYPAHDSVVLFLASHADALKCKVIGSSAATADICRSKLKTYQFFDNILNVPKLYSSVKEVNECPVFLKPEVGQGSKGVYIANSRDEVKFYIEKNPELLILEYLPGKEFTVDCFTDRYGNLRFAGVRERSRTMNGISVHTKPLLLSHEFKELADKINSSLSFRGAWFFQVKRNQNKQLSLLEIAPRIAGSMALHRCMGVNFALLSIFDAFDIDVDIHYEDTLVEMDRALENKYKIKIQFEHVYMDLDDCLIIDNKLNTELIKFLYQCLNQRKSVHLVSRHKYNIHDTLASFRIAGLFDQVHHLDRETPKSAVIKEKKAIFIDDSFIERREVFLATGIPVFAPDAVESLLQ